MMSREHTNFVLFHLKVKIFSSASQMCVVSLSADFWSDSVCQLTVYLQRASSLKVNSSSSWGQVWTTQTLSLIYGV